MAAKRLLDLNTFDDKLLDGLIFCRRVYDFFDQIRRSPDGIGRIRLRPTKLEKRLIEELLPLAAYVQARYCHSRRIKVRWFSGSLPYDAILWSSGPLVEHRYVARKGYVEITTSVHKNDYLRRQLIHQGKVSFGVAEISRDKKTGTITSKARAYDGFETSRQLADQVVERLRSKGQKNYPTSTVLIVNCIPNSIIMESEWNEAVETVRASGEHAAFREVFLLEMIGGHSATLWK